MCPSATDEAKAMTNPPPHQPVSRIMNPASVAFVGASGRELQRQDEELGALARCQLGLAGDDVGPVLAGRGLHLDLRRAEPEVVGLSGWPCPCIEGCRSAMLCDESSQEPQLAEQPELPLGSQFGGLTKQISPPCEALGDGRMRVEPVELNSIGDGGGEAVEVREQVCR